MVHISLQTFDFCPRPKGLELCSQWTASYSIADHIEQIKRRIHFLMRKAAYSVRSALPNDAGSNCLFFGDGWDYLQA
ncbi:hypothetical protein Plhal703r1_c31g0121781 [Plasmopara halstedii]